MLVLVAIIQNRFKGYYKTIFFIFPLLGIYVQYKDNLNGPNAGHIYYFILIGLFSTLLVLIYVLIKCRVYRINLSELVWFLFNIYAILNFLIYNKASNLYKIEELLVVAGIYLFFRIQIPTIYKNGINKIPIIFSLLIYGILVYAFLQYFEILPSRSEYFPFTSFFVNPASLSIFLTAICPYLAFYLVKSFHKSVRWKFMDFFMLLIFLLSLIIIVLSYSRSSWIAIIVMNVFCYILFIKKKRLSLFAITSLMAMFSIVLFSLYFIKPESAKGRILNYIVSIDILKDYPFFGVGWKNFSRYHNEYQMEYFQNNTDSLFRYLADDIGVAYNEFLRIAVELGVIGVLLFVLACLTSLYKTTLIKDSWIGRAAWFSTLNILTMCFFSYPLSQKYVMILFVLNLSVLAFLDKRELFNIYKLKEIAIILVPVVLILLYNNIRVIQFSLKWNKAFNVIEYNRADGIRLYKEIFPVLKNYPSFLYNYAYELSRLGELSNSINFLQLAHENMYNINILLLLGSTYQKLDKFEQAEKNFKKAKYLVPSRISPRYNLMKLYDKYELKLSACKEASDILLLEINTTSIKSDYLLYDVYNYKSSNCKRYKIMIEKERK